MRIVSPSQDVVMMCQSIEKLFEQKILGMPKEVGALRFVVCTHMAVDVEGDFPWCI